jgi:hypothetical protein
MDKKQIFEKRQYGDVRLLAEILGVSHQNAQKIIERPNSKRHKKAVEILTRIITDREKTIESAKKLMTE